MFAPPPERYIRFPAEFGQRVAMFVDTEEEFDWSQPKRRDATSVHAVRLLPKAHTVLRQYGLVPTYLVDYPVATTRESVNILNGFLERGECTIGTQLHPWVNPPFDEAIGGANSFPGNLPRALERAKIASITAAIQQNFGVNPLVYRAGRYGIGPNSEALLDEFGYRMDVSVRPFFDYRDEGGPSFTHTRTQPYWTGPERRIVEVPLTSALLGLLQPVGEPVFRLISKSPSLRGIFARTGLLNRVALTPEGIPLTEALEAIRFLLDHDTQLFSISFHSPSVEPGHTPYVRDAGDLRQFYAWFDGVFGLLDKAGVRPASIDEILDAAAATR